MVTLTIDEGILQVFEEQEEQFHFPVMSQKTARGFVKALHAKGLPYDDLCKEIDEFEHNFSAWRKGLGRVGIGKRILQRINAPLQDLLDSDDEDDVPARSSVTNRISSLKQTRQNGAESRRVNGNETTATATQNGSNAMSLHKLDKDSAKEKSRDLTEAWTKNIEDKMARIEKDRDSSDKSDEATDTNEWATREPTPPARDTFEQRELSESAKVFERIRGKKPGQDDTKTAPEEEQRKSSPEEPAVVMRQKSKHEEETEKRKSVKDLIANQEHTLSTPSSPQHSATEPKAADETREERLNRLQEKIAMLKKKFPKGENGEQEEGPDDSPTGTKPQSPVAARRASPIAERKTSPKPKSPLVSRSSSRSDSPGPVQHAASPKRASSSSQEDNHRISLKHVSTDITESYDSDLDIEALPEDEVTFEAKNLVAKLRNLKHSQQDGPGYLYVFGADDDCSTQFKVGASRFPSARLEQAQLFNPSLQMVVSVSVGRRREALRQAGVALESRLMQGTESWYTAPKQVIEDAVMQVADALPADDTSAC